MTRTSKKSAKTPSENEEATASKGTPSKVEVQFGPTPSAPGSRLKKSKGA